MKSSRRWILALVFLFLGTTLFAADGRISGRITRSDGSGIGGVIVQVVEIGKATISETNGAFTVDGVPPGTYSVRFEVADQVAAESNVVVRSGETTRLDKQVDWRLNIAETITVYSASRRAERVVEAPAAVTVVAPQDVDAVAPSGQAPRIVENAPGVDYTQSGLYDSNFNARGFNSSLNRRILTLVDGRDPAIAFLGAQEWAALSFPLDEMAAVELIRGPGSALYGANAFSGVLNMTTRRPRDSQGGRVLLSGGDLDTRRVDLRHAGALGGEWYYRVVGGYQNSGDYARSRTAQTGVEYTTRCTASGQEDCLPGEVSPLVLDEVNVRFGGLRLDKHFSDSLLTFEGGYSTIEGPVFQTGIGRVQVTDVERPWFRANYNMPHWNFSGYYDARKAENQVALASGARLFEDSYNLHGEVMTDWDLMGGRTRVVGGIAYNQQDVDTANPAGVQTLMSEAKSEEQQSAFGQIDVKVSQKLKLVGAARWDDSTLHDPQFSPKGAIVFEATPHHTLRYGYNEAFQRPNYSELFLRAPAGAPVNLAGAAQLNPASAPLAPVLQQLGFGSMAILALGNSALDVEKVRSHELGYSGIFGGRLYLTVDLYQSNMKDFVTDLLPGVNPAFPTYTVPSTLPPAIQAGLNQFLQAALGPRRVGLTTVNGAPALVLSYTNAGEVDTSGAEIAVNYYITDNWILDANYSLFDFEVKRGTVAAGDKLLPNAPETKYNIGLAFRSRKLDAKVAYRWVDGYRWAAGVFVGNVPQYDVVNLAANYRFTDHLALGVDVSNLFDNEHWEAFGGDLLQRRALASLTVRW
ncbi:MAG TPA: TonB-dependent receptor [Thermoanaerobaculia bacterium]|nr:TonB-dependent receptor [Thermoanaerobaculia bacterium]